MEWVLAGIVGYLALCALAACMRSSQISRIEESQQEADYRKRHVGSPHAD